LLSIINYQLSIKIWFYIVVLKRKTWRINFIQKYMWNLLCYVYGCRYRSQIPFLTWFQNNSKYDNQKTRYNINTYLKNFNRWIHEYRVCILVPLPAPKHEHPKILNNLTNTNIILYIHNVRYDRPINNRLIKTIFS
jgi:hypothetical protein